MTNTMDAKNKKSSKSKTNFMNNLMDDIFHVDEPICQIIETNTKEKQDYFKLFRPKPHTCLDYSISQTDTKMDAGNTKIHVQTTEAAYVPDNRERPPPKPKKSKYSSGAPPVWIFVDEIWQHQQKELQKLFKTEFKKRVAHRKKTEHVGEGDEHKRTVAMVGPEWFQELSPKQLATVDNLKNCISQDLALGTITHTQENIGVLGLVPRPNHRHIEKALKNCLKSPVEFLLILYQLINPHRTRYSINDRLLLSAVVHLTMRDTLKELHIRIPSPPPPPKVVKQNPKKRKPMKYDSPYLEPFIFKKEPSKFTGIYTNTHVQRPRSPYFCYLDELKKMREQGTTGDNCNTVRTQPVDDEIERELKLAQQLYEESVEFRPVPLLLRPSKYDPSNYQPKLNISKTAHTRERKTKRRDKHSKQICVAETEVTEEEYVVESTVEEINYESDTDKVEIKKPVCKECNVKVCRKKICYDEHVEPEDTSYIRETKSESFCPCSNVKDDQEGKTIKPCQSEKNVQKMIGVCTPTLRGIKYYCSDFCRLRCKNILKKSTDTPLCNCEKCVEERKRKNTFLVTGGLRQTGSKEAVPIIEGIAIGKPCECVKTHDKKTEEYMEDRARKEERPFKYIQERRKLVEQWQEEERNRTDKQLIAEARRRTARTYTHLEVYEKQQTYNKNITEVFYPKKTISLSTCACPNSDKYIRRARSEVITCKHAEDLKIYNKMYHVIRPKRGDEQSCTCKEQTQDLADTPYCQCKKCIEDRKRRSLNYVVNGLKQTESEETVAIIDRIAIQKPCDCWKKYENRIREFEKQKAKEAKRPCSCLKEIEKLISKSFCQCDKCQEDRRKKAAKYIFSGMKATDSECIRIIEGISMGRPCECVEKYLKRIKEYELFEQRKELVVKTKEQKQKFVIGGTVNTPEGPAYLISGMRPRIDCSCAKKAREAAAEKDRQLRMPKVPPGRVPFGIGGVKETPEGNVYILNSAVAIEECDCMEAYKTFAKQHSTCNEMYENYIKKMKIVYDKFLKETFGSTCQKSVASLENSDGPEEKEIESQRFSQPDAEQEQVEIKEKQEVQEVQEEEKVQEVEKGQEVQKVQAQVVSEVENNRSKEDIPNLCEYCTQCCVRYCSCGSPVYRTCCYCGKIQTVDCKHCTCGGEVIECVDCTCGPEEEEVEEEETVLRRFFIFKDIPRNYRGQEEILQHVLESMADDGYPLAKLPECYKLPHFKLWMQMRCRVFWTKDDQSQYILKTLRVWKHCDCCNAWPFVLPELGITKAQGKLLDWSKAYYCKKLIADCLENFYKTIRQNQIEFGREFFPSTFPYEFPTRTWRPCYFAYTPTKEEDVQARFVWKQHEFKNYADMKRHCRPL